MPCRESLHGTHDLCGGPKNACCQQPPNHAGSYKDDKANDFLPEKIPEHFARTFPVCLEQLRELKDTVDRCRCGNERADQIGANR